MAMSPDGKKLATIDSDGGTRIFESRDLTIQKYFTWQRPDADVGYYGVPVAFDPTNRFLAIGRYNGRVELRTVLTHTRLDDSLW
jgi:WD40 repeat protein